MIRRRLWRDAPLSNGRVVLGGAQDPQAVHRAPASASAPDPAPASVTNHEALTLRSDLLQAQARCAALEEQVHILQHATRDSEQTLTALRAEIDRERAAAQEQGYAAGLEKAHVAARTELDAQLRQWQRTGEEMLRAQDERTQTLRVELTDIVMAAVTKIIGEQAAHPHMARAAVEQTLRESGVSAPTRVLLAPGQYEQLLKTGAAQLAWFKERRIEVAADSRVTHGGCLLETAAGLVDGRFDVQLGKLREIVTAHYGTPGR